ncbi:TetR/AcrR family transcriptional regulator [Patulibacter defluvii]|uniref:TetR/AcrR family transcriptional regulator n=1 Tax=Patulibacter defluvii TaxID=3095358 RepID=UPI002A761945|nr:TetR/AcrR family transcriptional regulator [Patulibacter sp. DM4]
MAGQLRTRQRMTAEDRREQILDIAHAIVAGEGFHAATLNRIAAEAGVTRTVLYQQFGDLAGVFVALVDREAERAGMQFAAAIAAAGEPDEDDGAFGRTFAGLLRAIDDHPATWRLFLTPPEGAPPALHQRMGDAQAIVREHLQEVLLTINPELPDPEYTARILHAAGAEMLRLRLTDPVEATHERILAQVRRLTPGLVRQAR